MSPRIGRAIGRPREEARGFGIAWPAVLCTPVLPEFSGQNGLPLSRTFFEFELLTGRVPNLNVRKKTPFQMRFTTRTPQLETIATIVGSRVSAAVFGTLKRSSSSLVYRAHVVQMQQHHARLSRQQQLTRHFARSVGFFLRFFDAADTVRHC